MSIENARNDRAEGLAGDGADLGSEVVAGHFFAGTIGLSLIRSWYTDGDANERRLDELRDLINKRAEFPFSMALNPLERDALEGYAEWAESYDGPNPMIDAEQLVVRPMLERLASPGCDALDVACGTGRHAELLARLDCATVGVDQSPEMLEVARSKVPQVRFEVGTFSALPLDADSFDLAVCSLALCHLPDPTVGVIEIARVLRSGGTLVIADPHPMGALGGGQAFYGGIVPNQPMKFVRNHPHSAATWLSAFRAAGLEVVDCVETLIDDSLLATNPTTMFFPEAARTALIGLPHLFIWELRKI